GIVTEMIMSVRQIKAGLRPKLLDECGLVAALEWESERFQTRTGAKCVVRAVPEDLALPAQTATELFRIFQEIMANVAEHAQARRVEVALKQEAKGLILKVSDDGRGITAEQSSDPKAVGLLAMRERALG